MIGFLIGLALSLIKLILWLPALAFWGLGLWFIIQKKKGESFRETLLRRYGRAFGAAQETLWLVERLHTPRSTGNGFLSGLGAIVKPFGVPWSVIGCVALVLACVGAGYFFVRQAEERAALVERINCQRAAAGVSMASRDAQPAIVEKIVTREVKVEKIVHDAQMEMADAKDVEALHAAYARAAERVLAEREGGARGDRGARLETDDALSGHASPVAGGVEGSGGAAPA